MIDGMRVLSIVHIVASRAMAAALRETPPAPDDRVIVRSWANPIPVFEDVAALCAAPVIVDGEMRSWSVTDRALRAEPGRFEAAPICPDCLRLFARP